MAIESKYQVQKRLQWLDTKLQEVVNQPQGGPQQTEAMNGLVDLKKSLDGMMYELTPAQWDFLAERGVGHMFGPTLGKEIESRFSSSGVTPAVVKSYVGDIVGKRNKVLETFRTALSSLAGLNFKAEVLQPGQA